jgi:hypothetical protein
MKPKRPGDPITPQSPASSPLTDLVDDKLNKSVADQIVEKLDEKQEEPARSGASDYAHGTAEHEDDLEA